jgi:hypothetical protein
MPSTFGYGLDPECPPRRDAKVFSNSGFDVSGLRVIAEFRDANEVWWRIKPVGRIEEIQEPRAAVIG